MQLSMELLPAPLGPMMERISCSRTLNEMSVSAFTPPKRRLMFLMSRMTSPIFLLVMQGLSGGGAGRVGLGVDELERGADAALAPVLEFHLGLDELFALARVQGVDQHAVFVGDEVAPHLAC